jgi:tRNA (guanine37-N1)-methyltransferase
MIHFHVITLFPDIIRAYAEESILGRAQEAGRIRVHTYNPREYTDDPHRRIDDRPYGGGPGMVMQAEPIIAAARDAIGRKKHVAVFMMSATGAQFTNTCASELAQEARHIVLIAGHYEGVDARVRDALGAREITVGPFVLTGGELPALIILDATARFVPGVLGNTASLEEQRTAHADVYTRPATIKYKGSSYTVPEVLRSGDHNAIEAWRRGRRAK